MASIKEKLKENEKVRPRFLSEKITEWINTTSNAKKTIFQAIEKNISAKEVVFIKREEEISSFFNKTPRRVLVDKPMTITFSVWGESAIIDIDAQKSNKTTSPTDTFNVMKIILTKHKQKNEIVAEVHDTCYEKNKFSYGLSVEQIRILLRAIVLN